MKRIHLSYKLVSFDEWRHAALIVAVDYKTGEILGEWIESLFDVKAADALPASVLNAIATAKERYPDYDVVHPLKVSREA